MSTIGSDDRGDQEPPSDDLAAAEYVLGVLDAGPRLAAESRILTDRAFADLVAGWQRRFAPLTLELRPVEVPSRVWMRIRERLGWPLDEPSGLPGRTQPFFLAARGGRGGNRRARSPRGRFRSALDCPQGLRGTVCQCGDHAFTRRRLPRMARDRGCAPRYAPDGARAERSGRTGTRC